MRRIIYFVSQFVNSLWVWVERTGTARARLGTEALDEPSFGLRLVRGRVPQDGTGNT